MLKTVKLAHLFTLSSSPVPCSCKNLSFSDGSWIFRLTNDCSFFFFFRKKSCATAGQTFEGLTVDRLAQRTVCALTVEPRRNQHCKKSLESLLIGKTKLFRDENCSVLSTSTDVDQVHRLAAISSALLVPPLLKTEKPFFIYLFISLFFEMSPEESKKKKKKKTNLSLIPVSVL